MNWFLNDNGLRHERVKKWLDLDLTLSWRRPLSDRNQSTDLQSKSMNWFLYENGLRRERLKKPGTALLGLD